MTNEPQISKSSYKLVMKTQTSCWQSPTLSPLRCCRSSTRSLSLDTKEEKRNVVSLFQCQVSHLWSLGNPPKKRQIRYFLGNFGNALRIFKKNSPKVPQDMPYRWGLPTWLKKIRSLPWKPSKLPRSAFFGVFCSFWVFSYLKTYKNMSYSTSKCPASQGLS